MSEQNQTNNKSITSNDDDEISLIDLFAVLLHYKKLIIITTCLAAIFVVIFCVISLTLPPEKSPLPNEYTPSAQMLINDSSSSSSSGLSSMLSSSGLGSLASLAGVNVSGGSSYSALAGYLVGSSSILDAVIQKFNLVERYKIKKSPIAETRKALKEKLTSNFDEDTGVFTISFTDIDPVLAEEVVNYTVKLIEQRFTDIGVDKNILSKNNLEENIENSYSTMMDLQKKIQNIEYSVSYASTPSSVPSIMTETTMLKLELQVQEQIYAQLKAQYEMLKVTMASEQPIFQILQYAEVPDKKSGPSRGMICIIVVFAAGFISVFMAFLLNAIKNIRKDPEAMQKLRGTKREQK